MIEVTGLALETEVHLVEYTKLVVVVWLEFLHIMESAFPACVQEVKSTNLPL